ncbi:MAG: hypothetical protein RL637_758, partial [Pseudomonadota bacterium]
MKKIFFIHVGKTAGSAFNLFLQKQFNGEDHCERYLIDEITEQLSNKTHLEKLDYISAHLNLSVFLKNFAKQDYFVLTFLREPIAHLISHINWVMYIKEISPQFFAAHPEYIKAMTLELRADNLYHPDVFISKMIKFSPLFQNYQAKHFRKNPDDLSVASILDHMSILDMVGITENYSQSLATFIELNDLKIHPTIEIVNKNPVYKIEKDILDNKTIYDFVNEY